MIRPERVRILINPRARANRTRRIDADKVRGLVGPAPKVTVTHTKDMVAPLAAEVIGGGTDLVVVAGGDGTLHLLVTELVRASSTGGGGIPPLLILRSGTMNMAANNFADPRSPVLELRVLGALLEGGPFEVPTIRAAPLAVSAGNLDRPIYGFVFANGIAFSILKEYYAGEPSVARAFNVTASIVAGAFISKDIERKYFPDLSSIVRVDGREVMKRHLRIAVAASAPRLLLWFTPFAGLEPADGCFHFLANNMKTRKIARHFWPLCRGRYSGPGYFNGSVREVEILDGGGFTVDGEVYEDHGQRVDVRIEAGPPLEFVNLDQPGPSRVKTRR